MENLIKNKIIKKKGTAYKVIMKKFFIVFNLMLFVLLFFGCSENNNENNGIRHDNPYFVYEMAKNEGFTGTYEEWLELIKGIDGNSIVDVEINDKDELVITMSDNETINLGCIKGETGNGILKIELTKSDGLVDIYTIYYTDGTTSTYTVTNGEDGDKGNKGDQGEQGTPGKSAYEIYLEQHPEYNKSEEEWMEDLVNGNLGKKYVVSFDSKGGSVVDEQIVNHSEKITKPEDPTRSGYKFLGWYYGDEKWSFIGYVVTENITLTAKWESLYGISIDSIETTYTVGETLNLSVSITSAEFEDANILWGSSNFDVASITGEGVVTFLAPGKVTLFATVSGTEIKVYTEEIIVERPSVEKLFIEGYDKINVNDSMVLSVSGYPNYADTSVVWSTSNSSIASINQDTGEVKGLKSGSVIITAVSKYNTNIYATFTLIVIGEDAPDDPFYVSVIGPKTCLIGYRIKLSASVYPVTAIQNVVWECSNPSVLKIDENGNCLGLSAGVVRVRARSAVDSTVRSEYFTIQVTEDTTDATEVDMQGYKIVIMNSETVLSDIDPFLDGYTSYDKEAKKSAWHEVEEKYNCDLSVEAYPSTASWGAKRINYINNAVSNGAATADIYTISSGWLKDFVDADSALDITEYYEKYGKFQMDSVLKLTGTVENKLYIVSTGTSPVSSAVDLGLFYDYNKLISLGVKDPAEMFNNGEWNYTNFVEWVNKLQSKLGYGEYALGGHSLYYWIGLTNAAGIKITDPYQYEVNVDTNQSKIAMEMMNELVNNGAVNPVADWAEGGGNDGFQNQKVVMTTGHLGFITNEKRWKDMWGAGETNIGYVPFPYPDVLSKDCTRISQSSIDSILMYVKGREGNYAFGVTAEYVYKAVNEVFLTTNKKIEQDPTFDAQGELRSYFRQFFENESSVEAAMYFNDSKIFYDATLSVYSSIASSPFNNVTKQIMYNGADYENTVDSVYDDFRDAVMNKFN